MVEIGGGGSSGNLLGKYLHSTVALIHWVCTEPGHTHCAIVSSCGLEMGSCFWGPKCTQPLEICSCVGGKRFSHSWFAKYHPVTYLYKYVAQIRLIHFEIFQMNDISCIKRMNVKKKISQAYIKCIVKLSWKSLLSAL